LLKGGIAVENNIFEVTVDQALTFDEMIKAGEFVEVVGDGLRMNNPDRRKKGEGKIHIQMRVIETDEPMSREEVSLLLDQNNLRLADIRETLAFAAQHPKEHLEAGVLGLGDSCDCGSFLSDVVALGSGDPRSLYVGSCDLELPPTRIAAVVRET